MTERQKRRHHAGRPLTFIVTSHGTAGPPDRLLLGEQLDQTNAPPVRLGTHLSNHGLAYISRAETSGSEKKTGRSTDWERRM